MVPCVGALAPSAAFGSSETSLVGSFGSSFEVGSSSGASVFSIG